MHAMREKSECTLWFGENEEKSWKRKKERRDAWTVGDVRFRVRKQLYSIPGTTCLVGR
jgi:hypothetical protein